MPEELKQHIKEKQSLRPNEVELNLIYLNYRPNLVCLSFRFNNCFFWNSSFRPTLFGCRAREKILPMLRTLGHAIIILAWDSPIIIFHSKTLRATYRQSLLFSSPLKVSINRNIKTYIINSSFMKSISIINLYQHKLAESSKDHTYFS